MAQVEFRINGACEAGEAATTDAASAYIEILERYWGIPFRLDQNPITKAAREKWLAERAAKSAAVPRI